MPPTTYEPALHLAAVTKTFRTARGTPVHAVRGVDLDVQPGEVVACLGPNGAGKTTTMDMVLGLTAPSTGTLQVFGAAPREAVRAGRVSAVLQSGGLLRDLSVRETVRLVASTFGTHAGVDHVMDRAGLTALAGRKVSKCSGGEQQRLRFALALLPDPDLLVLDEPTAGMDVGGRRAFWSTMHAEADAGRTIVFATHYLEEANTFAQRIVLMANGQVMADGSTEQIRARASGRTVSADLPVGRLPAAVSVLRELAGVRDVQVSGARVTVVSGDSDAVARILLTDLGGHDLEVSSGSLEAAFVAITGETTEGDAR